MNTLSGLAQSRVQQHFINCFSPPNLLNLLFIAKHVRGLKLIDEM